MAIISAKCTLGTCSPDGGVFANCLGLYQRGDVHQKKMDVHFSPSSNGFPPFNLIVFCIDSEPVRAETQKKRVDPFHYEEQVSPVRNGRVSLKPL